MRQTTVWVTARICEGMFSSERHVELEDFNGNQVSFFTDRSHVDEAEGAVRGILLEADGERSLVRFQAENGHENVVVFSNALEGAATVPAHILNEGKGAVEGAGVPYAEWPEFSSMDEWLSMEAEIAEAAGVEIQYNWPKLMGYAEGYAADLLKKEREEQATRIRELETACRNARDAIDRLMGDSDLDDDDSPEFCAMQELTRVLGVEVAGDVAGYTEDGDAKGASDE